MESEEEEVLSVQQDRQRPSVVNFVLLLFAAAASLATLAPDHHSGRSDTDVEWPRGATSQRLLVTIEPLGNRLDAFEYSGSFHLELEMRHIEQSLADTVLWALSLETRTGEPFHLDGGFPEFGGDVHHEDNGEINGDISVRIGRLCPDEESSDGSCIPCPVDTGCSLTIDVERCHIVGDHLTQVEVRLVDDAGSQFQNRCERDGEVEPCAELDRWIDMENEPLRTSLCR